MCRFAAYLGAPRSLGALLYDPPRSLSEQAHSPREQLHGTVNVDGTGVAWWPDDAPGPLRYVTTSPPWADPNLGVLAPYLRAGALVAAVRGATPGMPGGSGAVAPFTFGGLAIAHNGWLGGFRAEVGTQLASELPPSWLSQLDVMTDSAVLALHVAARLDPATSLATTVSDTVGHVARTMHAAGQPATLNLVVSDGRRVVANRASVGGPCNSLYTLTDGAPPWSDGVLVASEPLDDHHWKPVAPDHMVELGPDGLQSFPLDLGVTG